MPEHLFPVALIPDVFYDDPHGERLHACLSEAQRQGAALAVLPELPLNPWSPAHQTPVDTDAEEPGGPRHQRQAEIARDVGLALLGGAIVRDPSDGQRYNTALLFDASGGLVATYRKLHLPEEEGYWETFHYRPGTEAPRIIEDLGPALGVQICSDINRPEGAQLLAAQGVEVILAPRATPTESYPRWRLVYQATAITSAAYVVSINRPRPESGVPMGGPSLVVSPDGIVVCETDEEIVVVPLDLAHVAQVRTEYPGYLPFHTSIYAKGWKELER